MATATQLFYPHIVKRPGYCGGKVALDGTRVRVMNVVFLLKQGLTPEQMLSVYPDLSLAQVHGALVYYYDHVEEIEGELEGDRGAADRFEDEKADAMARRAGR